MQYVIIDENGKVLTLNVDKSIFERAVEAPDDIVFGDRYENGEWIRCGKRPEPVVSTPTEQREREYESNPLIEWEGGNITVDQANIVFLRYFAENNPKAEAIRPLIIAAKQSIRQMYPDGEE